MLTFARTKIQRPRPRPGAVLARPPLQQRLVDAMTSRSLVLVCATAGFGKTTALTQALDQLPAGTAVAWIGVDDGDTPLQLFSCLVAALEPYDLPWRVAPESLIAAALAGGSDPAGQHEALRHMVTELINALDACDVPHGVIAVDDLHHIEQAAVYQFLDLLLERFTPRWTMVLASRQPPPIALHRLRARGDIAEFGANDLRFDAAQAQAIVLASGLAPDAAAALHQRTQGWPAGLRLALNVLASAPGASLSGTTMLIDRQVFEFLATEVLDRLPTDLRQFLLSTSVLPELTAARCAAVTGDARAADRLEAIERAGLFVTTLPDPEPTLRLHDLFRDALEHRLRRDHADDIPRLLERAARSEPDGVRRLGYWMGAERWTEAARELHLQSHTLLIGSQSTTVEGWMARFPAELQHTLPDLHAVRALIGWLHWRWQDMIAAAHAAAEGFEQTQRPLEAMAARAYEVLALRGGGQRDASATLAHRLASEVEALLAERRAEMQAGKRWDGHEPGMLAAMLGRESVVWSAFDDARFDDLAVPTQASIALLDHTTGVAPFFQMLPLPAYIGLRGMGSQLARYVRQARARLKAGDDTQMGTFAQAIDGSLRVWAGDVAAGRDLLRDAACDVRWHDFPLRGSEHVYPFLCVADLLLGDTQALIEDAQVFEHVLMRATERPDIGQRAASEFFSLARLLFAGGQDAAALRLWRMVAPWHDARTRPVWTAQCQSQHAYMALAEGRLVQAEQGFAQVLAEFGDKLEILGQTTELRLRTADLRLRLGRPPRDAAAMLTPVFERHANDADIASVWLVGPERLRALAQARWSDALVADHRDTLSAWADRAASLRDTAHPVTTAGDPPAQPANSELTEREFEVLARIAAGDSNKLIARAFDLSPHTVKRHVANILDKLDLRSRGQAAAWYHDHHA